ncbi:adenylate/guanylate cyclase domain-containing protein [Acetobacteraceae bacterium ESL0709]|nr:adenylate/guanylate cyclase domain-containing protein [Acetobacteraceae bacterium ESL0697]MDF7678208.1 adenylate/guanylate cyclase domain-containing protein [Acetobacteraceae bacterium ESL0709]
MSSPSNRRWQIAQFLIPIFGVILVIGAIIVVSLHNFRTTRDGAIELSRSLLLSDQRYITQEVTNYLSPARSSSVVARDMLNSDNIDRNVTNFVLLGRSILKNVPQVSHFYLADDEGHFWFVGKSGENYEETTYEVQNGQPVFMRKTTDGEGRVLKTDAIKSGVYDPRVHSWYQGAISRKDKPNRKKLFWRDPYPYPYRTSSEYMITASSAFKTVDGRQMVFAINISLNDLTNFVNGLKVGKSGRAVIVDVNGHVIAGHNMAQLGQPGFDASKVQLDPKTQPVFVRSLNIFRIKGDGAGMVRVKEGDKERNYVTIASAMTVAKKSWVLLLNAPASDFSSFARKVQKQNIYFSFVVIFLSCFLALGLIYQGRRVIHYQKMLKKGREKIRAESAGLFKIANTPALLDPDKEIPVMTEVLTERGGAKRASIWRLLPDGKRLLCEDMFDRQSDAHGSGMELSKQVYPGLFECLNESQFVDVPDASEDERFRSVQRVLMRSVGASHLLFISILEQHNPVGAILIEDPTEKEGLERTVALVSSIEALRFAERNKRMTDSAPEETQSLEEAMASAYKQPFQSETGFLLDPEKQEDGPPQDGLYLSVPIMVLEFVDSYTTQRETAQHNLELINELTAKVQTKVREAGLFSMQVAGNRVIFLGSCQQKQDVAAVLRLADVAVDIREICLNIISGLTTKLMFRIGIDVGPLMAAHIGDNPTIFNVWGTALNTADLMAHNAPDGGQIQVSEQAYIILRGYFLFRPRGDFYLPGRGVTRSYIMAGRR